MYFVEQTDVSGDCPVEYEVIDDRWGANTIIKKKDLLGCTERHGLSSAFQGSPYRVNSVSNASDYTEKGH